MKDTTGWRPIRPGYCCVCGLKPLPRSLTDTQALDVLHAWTVQGIHPHDYAARWTSVVEAASKLQRGTDTDA